LEILIHCTGDAWTRCFSPWWCCFHTSPFPPSTCAKGSSWPTFGSRGNCLDGMGV